MELNSAEVQQGNYQLIGIRKIKRDFGFINDYLTF